MAETLITDTVIEKLLKKAEEGLMIPPKGIVNLGSVGGYAEYDSSYILLSAPLQPTFDADKLNELADNLLEGLPYTPDGRAGWQHEGLYFYSPRLRSHEKDIGTKKLEWNIRKPSSKLLSAVDIMEIPEPKTSVGSLIRSTTIILYPHPDLVRLGIKAYQGRLPAHRSDILSGYIHKDAVKRLQEGNEPYPDPNLAVYGVSRKVRSWLNRF